MTTWIEKLREFECDGLFATRDGESNPFAQEEWQPTDADRAAAWALYTEVRTRITTQPLAYRHGDEESALDSVYRVFELTRDAIKEHEGCRHFATLAVHVLNVHIRPFTAEWHKIKLANRLASSDVRHRFRRDLTRLQSKLSSFLRLLGHLAEGDVFCAATASGVEAAESPYRGYDLGEPLPFGVAGSRVSIDRASEIDGAEREEVLARRKAYGLEQSAHDAVGLAVSGGGIRSATFSLGVVQFLARKGILKQVDFLSTVSGGGYTGSFLSSYLNDPDNAKAGLDPDRHEWPFGGPGDDETRAVRHLRNHSKYITEGGAKAYALIFGMMLWGIAINLLLTLPLVMVAVMAADLLMSEAFVQAASGSGEFPPQSMAGVLWWIGMGLLGSAVALPVVQSLGRHAAPTNSWLRAFSSNYERGWCIGLFVALLVVLGFSALPWAFGWYHWLVHDWIPSLGAPVDAVPGGSDDDSSALVAALTAALPFAAGALQFVAKEVRFLGKAVMMLFAVSGPVFFGVAFFYLIDVFVVRESEWFWTVFTVVVLYGAILVNINYTSPHRYYRRQLSRTYLRRAKRSSGAGEDHLEETEHLDAQRLSELNQHDANRPSKAPYHLINCALSIPACDDPDLRGRAADFFLFSKHFCGSPILSYWPTTDWEKLDGHVDLGTAMSISAGAAAPNMGTATMSSFRYLLAILNVRLNYWVLPPRVALTPDVLRRRITPGVFYFFKEMTGLFMHEKGGFQNLSDGGHIENLALYELLRRRCKFIIAIDAEADPKRTFPGLLTLVRLAKIDLGVKIEPDLEDLRADDRGDSRSHFLMCEIEYPGGQKGLLLYTKLSMTGNESEFLQKYRAEHPAFPHQSTADQLFDEPQFEAYRALGEHIGEDLFRSDLVDSTDPNAPKLGDKPSVRDWFQGLASNLLEPDR